MPDRNMLTTRRGRLTIFSLLYLSEGIPFGFTAITLVTFMRQQGLGLDVISAFTASLYAPWAFKPLWGPLVDLIKIRRFGHYRFWIFAAQVMMILTLAVVMIVKPGTNLPLLTTLIIIHNIFACCQDVAIDALAVTVLPEKERGVANGFMFGAAYLGQALGGSGALLIAGKLGYIATFPYVCGLLLLILLTVTLRLSEPADEVQAAMGEAGRRAADVLRAVGHQIRDYGRDLYLSFFRSGAGPFIGVFFCLAPAGALALGLALGSTMMVDLGMDETEIAELGIYSTIIAALGCVAGGWISDRLGHRKMLAIWYVLTALPTLWLAQQFAGSEGMEGVTVGAYWIAALCYSMASGLLSGTSMAVFMGLSSPAVAATQFSGYMALKNLMYTYSARWQGWFAADHGYASTMHLDVILAVLPLVLLPFIKPSTRSRRA